MPRKDLGLGDQPLLRVRGFLAAFLPLTVQLSHLRGSHENHLRGRDLRADQLALFLALPIGFLGSGCVVLLLLLCSTPGYSAGQGAMAIGPAETGPLDHERFSNLYGQRPPPLGHPLGRYSTA